MLKQSPWFLGLFPLTIFLLTSCITQRIPTPIVALEPDICEVANCHEADSTPEPTSTVFPTAKPSAQAPAPPEPIPPSVINGGVVQDGPFTFFVGIYHEPSLNQKPITTSLYSDLNGFGAYLYWVYQGSEPLGSVMEWYGIEPNLLQLGTYASLKAGDSGGRSGGIFLPGGHFIEGHSIPGDQVKWGIKLTTNDQTFGAAITFTLIESRNGLQPDSIGAPMILETDQPSGPPLLPMPKNKVETWSDL